MSKINQKVVERLAKEISQETIYASALNMQVDGNHYKKYKIQPMEYIHANNIPFAEGNAIKYITRWRDKGGLKDIDKAIHILEMLKELELKK
jgi:hypothetical protein